MVCSLTPSLNRRNPISQCRSQCMMGHVPTYPMGRVNWRRNARGPNLFNSYDSWQELVLICAISIALTPMHSPWGYRLVLILFESKFFYYPALWAVDIFLAGTKYAPCLKKSSNGIRYDSCEVLAREITYQVINKPLRAVRRRSQSHQEYDKSLMCLT